MAEGRIIKKKISESERVNSLPGDGALFFSWMILHLDRDGRIKADPTYLKRTVMPLRDCTTKHIEKWLEQMESLKDEISGEPLIERYAINNKPYLWMPGFKGEQGQARFDDKEPAWYGREGASELPAPPEKQHVKVPGIAGPRFTPDVEIPDPVLLQMKKYYEENIGLATPIIMEAIIKIRNDYEDGWFEDAVKDAVNYGKKNMKYIQKVLENRKTGKVPAPGRQNNSGASGSAGEYEIVSRQTAAK